MKFNRLTLALFLILALMVVAVGTALASSPGEELESCPGDNVSGTVVAVDPATNVVTISTDEGLCTVNLSGSFDHPIVTLLGAYFGDVKAKTLEAALNDVMGCALYDEESETWAWADCESDGAVHVRVTGEDDDGNFIAVNLDDENNSEIIISIDDKDTADDVRDALEALNVDWSLDEGDVADIAHYHEEGMGFGVLVKLYSLSNETGIPVEQLIEEFRSGTGIGQLFEMYGKPQQLGVGHVRQEMKQDGETDPDQDPQPQKNGKDKDKGKDKDTPEDKNKETGKDKDKETGKDKQEKDKPKVKDKETGKDKGKETGKDKQKKDKK